MSEYEIARLKADRINREIHDFIRSKGIQGCDGQDFFRFIHNMQMLERMNDV